MVLPSAVIEPCPKAASEQDEKIEIMNGQTYSFDYTKKTKLVSAALILSTLILVLTGLAFEMSSWKSSISTSDISINEPVTNTTIPLLPTRIEKSRSKEPFKVFQTSTQPDKFETKNTEDNIRIVTKRTTTEIASKLPTVPRSETTKKFATDRSIEFTATNNYDLSVCNEFKFTSNDLIMQNNPEFIGLYGLAQNVGVENIFVNRESGLVLFQSEEAYITRQGRNFTNIWFIESYQGNVSSHNYVYNGICNDVNFPVNGACQRGWMLCSEKEGYCTPDFTASMECNYPHNDIKTLPNSICQQFELKPEENLIDQNLEEFVGFYEFIHYENYLHNQMPVYRKLNSSISLFTINGIEGNFEWAIADERLMTAKTTDDLRALLRKYEIKGAIMNRYCPDVQYPANGQCAINWIYHSTSNDYRHFVAQFYTKVTIQCTRFQ